MKQIDVKKIVSLTQLEDLRRRWNGLLASCLRPTVFASWEWQYLSARFFAEDQKLEVLAAYSGEILVGVLPLHQVKARLGGIIPATVLRPLGGGLTDYNVLMIREKYLSSVIPAFAQYLKRRCCLVDFENVLPGSPLAILGRYLTRRSFYQIIYESKTALATRLTGDYDSFMKERKKKFRRTLSNNRNYMNRMGGYSYHSENATTDLLAILMTLHTSRWEHKGERGALAQKQIKDFHTAIHEMPDKVFDIRYYTIRHNNNVAAILYGFIFRDRYYAYLAGFDMAHNRISPGNMVFNYCIQELYRENIAVFDMLRGDMKYKHTWATISYDMIDAFYFPPTFFGRCLYRMVKTIQAIKRIIPSGLKKGLKSISQRSIM
jgi:CelD/BcsL family acetyltransferase involved in cellulose biosynthesis